MAPDRDRRRGQHLAQPGAGGLLADEVDHLHAVLRRVGVGHRHDRGEAAERGRPAAGLDRLGLLLAGLAQMGVQVDEAGADDAARGVDHLVAVLRREIGADLGDPAVGDAHVARSFTGLVEQTPAA